MVRELAGYDPVRAQQVIRWPLREALIAYVDRMKQAAAREFTRQTYVWAMLAPHTKDPIDPPRPPEILRS